MKRLLRKNSLLIAGIIVGAIGGYIYWRTIGCSSGNCSISSKPLNSMAYFALLGGLLSGFFTKKEKPKENT